MTEFRRLTGRQAEGIEGRFRTTSTWGTETLLSFFACDTAPARMPLRQQFSIGVIAAYVNYRAKLALPAGRRLRVELGNNLLELGMVFAWRRFSSQRTDPQKRQLSTDRDAHKASTGHILRHA
jgi:hypothetical protein